jgi:hypothetical protein
MNNLVIAITGPTGSGKSTVGEALAKRLEKCVNIDADSLKHMIVSGFYFDEENPDDPKGWGFSEWEIVGESIGLLAKNFLDHGYSVVINGYIDAPAWDTLNKYVDITYKYLLLPKLDEIVNRDQGREESIRMGEETVAIHYSHFSNDKFFDDFIKLDTTEQSIDDSVSQIHESIFAKPK